MTTTARGRAGRGAVALGLVLLASTLRAAPLAAAPELGFGQAQAVLVMIDPRSAELSFGVRFGPTVTDHRNQVARAVAQSTDYGLIGSALTGEGCTGRPASVSREQLPQRLRADSRNPGEDQERTVQEGPITQSVLARSTPFAQATSRLAELEIPGALRVAGASNRTTSGADDAGLPTATGDVDIAELSLAGGVVMLRGLHWEAVFGHGEEPHGAFTIGSASIGGTPIPTQDASAAVAAVNAVLSQLGLVLTPPRSHVEQGTLFVDPIRLGITPNPTRDQVAGTTLAAIQPVREQLFAALLQANCDSAALITVLDILLGSFTGGGSLTVNIGGTQAQLTRAEGFGGLGAISTDAPPVLGGGPATGGGAVLGTPPVTQPLGTGTDDGADGEVRRVGPIAVTDTDTESDGALGVGIGALVLGVLLVAADHRRLRKAGVGSAGAAAGAAG